MTILRQWRSRLHLGSGLPLYQQIVDLVRQDVAEGHLTPGTQLPSLRALSEGLGVGMITARKALRHLNEAGLVLSRRGSGSIIAEPAARAGDSADRQPLRLGVVFAEIEAGYPFFRPMLEAIQASASPQDRPVQLQLIQLAATIDQPNDIAHRLPLRTCDGLLMFSPVNPVVVSLCRQRALPYVLLFNLLTDGVSRCVSPDYHTGMIEAMAHLKQRGRRRVALVTADPSRFSTGQVSQAFELALRNQGFSVDPRLVRAGRYDQESGFETADELLGASDRPDAIVFASDYQACGGCLAVEQRGLRVGDDVAIIACGGVLAAREWPQPLATIDLNLATMGQVAVRTLRQLIARESPPYFQSIASSFRPGETA